MRYTLPTFLLIAAAPACWGQSGAVPGSPTTGQATARAEVMDVTPQQLAAMLKSSTILVLDVNEDETYAEAHVPGARLMVYDEITAEKLPPDHHAALAFYCYSPECPAAGLAARSAADLGFMNVYCMKAGITGWQDAGLPTEP
jgi:rhodanese-related sulfurtransferase